MAKKGSEGINCHKRHGRTLRIFVICGCARLVRTRMSLVHTPAWGDRCGLGRENEGEDLSKVQSGIMPVWLSVRSSCDERKGSESFSTQPETLCRWHKHNEKATQCASSAYGVSATVGSIKRNG